MSIPSPHVRRSHCKRVQVMIVLMAPPHALAAFVYMILVVIRASGHATFANAAEIQRLMLPADVTIIALIASRSHGCADQGGTLFINAAQDLLCQPIFFDCIIRQSEWCCNTLVSLSGCACLGALECCL